MKPRLFWRRMRAFFTVFLLLVFAASGAQFKPVHLRSNAPVRSLLPSSVPANSPLSGLFLLQFKTPPDDALRQLLGKAGIELLHYIPEGTYLAHFKNVAPGQLTAFSSLQWIGQYLPEHKIHKAVAAKTTNPLRVTILVSPSATSSEIAQVRNRLSRIQHDSTLRSGTVLRGTINPNQLDALARSDSVLWIEPAHDMKLFDEVASKIVAGDGGPQVLLTQSLGYDGRDVNVAVADSGLDNGDAASMHPDLFGRTPEFFFYGALTDASDEHSHGTHVAGIIAGNGATGETDDNGALYGLGVAPGANIIAQRIFDAVGNFESPPSFEKLTRDATRAGAVIGSNSWGDDTQGGYDVSAMEFDELVRDADALQFGDQQYILEFSAGNAGPGPQTVGSPAVAKNVIATGAAENDRLDFFIYADGPDAMADFSSRGPCEDGRIKPDLVAPGTWISSLQSASATDQYAWSPIDDNYQYQGGTSQAGPHASGAAAVFVQFYRETHANQTPSPALVKAALVNTATDMDDSFGTGPVPNFDEGWGRVDLTAFFDPSLSFKYLDQTIALTNGQVFEQQIVVNTPDQPLKITLAYTDPPGFPGAIPALVNDLDLEVIGPGGQLYRGNQFDQSESIPNPNGRDNLNNVEVVQLAAPQPGEYTVRVRGYNVVADVHGDPSGLGQDFALVISASFASPGASIISLDRAAYTAPAAIRISLVDTDLAGQTHTTVIARSGTEHNGELVTLTASSPSGGFTGSIATAVGPVIRDGRLQVANNDLIEVIYTDSSLGVDRTATALADLVSPVLSNITVTNEFGQTIVSWNSSEPATPFVAFGTNASSLASSATGTDTSSSQSVTLDDLVQGATYYFYVVSTDLAGNSTTNNTGLSVVIPFTSSVLLVDEYQDPTAGVPPLSGYTDPLNQVGVSYDVWDVGSRGAPPVLANLRAYHAVIWRVPDFNGAWSTAEQSAISNYLASGGALFVASMEILSRLEDGGATNFVRKVLQVQSYTADTGAPEVIGSPVEPVGSGLDVPLDFTLYEDLWAPFIQFGIMPDPPDFSDTIVPTSDCTPVLRTDTGNIVGLRWPGLGKQTPGRLVLLTFPLDTVPMQNGINDRVMLLRNILTFLSPGISGAANVTFDSAAYKLPSLVTVQIGDTHKSGLGLLSVNVSSTTQSNGLTVTVVETPKKGIFLGSLPLISATNPLTPGKLLAKNGDTLTLKYFDTSVASFVTATAQVDTNPPSISNVSADPDYQIAVVTWTTSEPTDALVQFGGSTLLGRTAYDPGPATTHSVTLVGLVPDRTYYYQVVSTDVAGNTSSDNNHNALYTLRTLRPINTPWSDNLDSGAGDWSFFSADGSQSDWTLGVPANGLESSAHSPPNAWGSILNGQSVDYVETYLISPALLLTNGNVATLNFWHSYDFSDPSGSGLSVEVGEVQVVYDNGSTVASLGSFQDFTSGWEPVKLDLSPYIGQVVYVVWYYVLFSLDDAPHPGWLVDDVSVTVSNVQPGAVQISNNLWQTTCVLSGPMFRKIKGLGLTLSNAPPGQYVLEFADVPYYLTPPPLTNTLAPGGFVAFQGNYTFPDINTNGISDLWEQQFFGVISPTRTQLTDTDGDGMTDYAEFIAGTDPNSLPPRFQLSAQRLSGAICRLEWPSQVGQQFRVQNSTNLQDWNLYSGWLQATDTVTKVDVSIPANGLQNFFRIEVLSTNAPSNLAPNLRISESLLSNGQLRLQWNTASGRGYQLQRSTNGVNWVPVSAWTRAVASTMSYSLPAPAYGTMFRVQVQP